jgi:predicted NACHT family NTPase
LPSREAPAADLIPLLVRLRELGPEDDLKSHLLAILGLQVHGEEDTEKSALEQFTYSNLAEYLDRLNALVLIDGLDEAHPDARGSIMKDLRELTLRTSTATIVVTCRKADYRYNLEKTIIFHLLPLDEAQVSDIAKRWLGRRSATFLRQVRENPYAGAEVRPLTLAHLLAIFERTGKIPEKPKAVYRKIIQMLIADWDEERQVERHSKYAGFDAGAKHEFLRASIRAHNE